MRVEVGGLRCNMTSRRLGGVLCVLGFLWGITLINMTIVGYEHKPNSQQLKAEILHLSEKYVKALAKETENTIDGPYTGRLTDLKKTLAVLVDNMMERLTRLERKVDEAIANNTFSRNVLEGPGEDPVPSENDDLQDGQNLNDSNDPNQKPVDVKGLIMGVQENCEITETEDIRYPHCKGKMAWMKTHWTSDPCYAAYGVDGSDCSFRVYLSEVEPFCPILPARVNVTRKIKPKSPTKLAIMNFDLDGLMQKLQDPGQRNNYQWMRMRISRLWSRWVSAGKQLSKKQNMTAIPLKKMVIYIGSISKAAHFDIVESAGKGGPLGELVQWSDIISALYLLGHDLTITSEVEQLQAFLRKSAKNLLNGRINSACPLTPQATDVADVFYTDLTGVRQIKRFGRATFPKIRILTRLPSAEAQCQSRDKLPIDMIYTDIVGLTQFKRKVKNGYGKFSCLLRIIDSFGTEPAFNWEAYAKSHKLKTQWGMQNLHPQQFFTMFPHSPDNSFMGFVVENHINDSIVAGIERKPMAVVYGKADYMWQGKENYLSIIKDYVEIHGTVFKSDGKSSIPPYVINHGILSGPELHKLLRQSKIFIGLGFPYEGPAPLEAIAHGNVFINPKFSPPHSSENTKFFKGKPTLRKLTSQHPYVEDFMKEPHVFTVDINKPDQVKQAVEQALLAHEKGKIQSYEPYEFTEEGMLQRLSSYIYHQDFCSREAPLWPPEQSVSAIVSHQGQSCKDACRENNMICEPSHFSRLNQQEELEKHLGSCSSLRRLEDIYFPAFQPSSSQCMLQQQPMLFSCVGENPDLARLCPCRDFIQGQTALCKDCL